jgi:predicted permease
MLGVGFGRLLQDLRLAGRRLRKEPGFAATAILTLGLGVGANTIGFTLLNALVFRAMPVRDPSSVVRINPVDAQGQHGHLFSVPDYLDYRTQVPQFEALVAYVPTLVTIGPSASDGAPPEETVAYAVSANYFQALGVVPSLGRPLLVNEELTSTALPPVVISHSFWTRRLGTDPGVIGRTVLVNGRGATIVGVGPESFVGTEPLVADLYVPLGMQPVIAPGPALLGDRNAGWLLLVARLREGVAKDEAARAMNLVARRLAAAYPSPNRTTAVEISRGTFFTLDPALRPTLLLAWGLAMLVLMVACANVANLTLARFAARRREVALRLALGATRWRLVGQLLTESLLIALLGGLAGLLIAQWTLRTLYPMAVAQVPFRWTFVLDLGPDLAVFAFALALCAGTALLFGLLPALHSSKAGLSGTIQGAHRHSSGNGLRSHALVIAQISACLTLLVGAGLLARGVGRAQALDLGFDPRGVVFANYDLSRHSYPPARAREFNDRLADAVRRSSSHAVVGFTSHVPLTGGVSRTQVRVRGRSEPIDCSFTIVSPGYFEVLRMPIIRGRDFTDADTHAPVVVLSEALARSFWPNQDPLGQTVITDELPTPVVVVGVVRDSTDASLWQGKETSLYVPVRGPADYGRLRVLARTGADPQALASTLSAAARGLDPNVSVDVQPLQRVLRLWTLPSRVAAFAAATLGTVALLIAAVGLYGVMAYRISRRHREIGVRMAVGADARAIVRLFVGEGMRVVAVGVIVGVLASLGVARALRAFLYGLSSVDPLAFAAAIGFLATVMLLACYLPARRAARILPVVAFRQE